MRIAIPYIIAGSLRNLFSRVYLVKHVHVPAKTAARFGSPLWPIKRVGQVSAQFWHIKAFWDSETLANQARCSSGGRLTGK